MNRACMTGLVAPMFAFLCLLDAEGAFAQDFTPSDVESTAFFAPAPFLEKPTYPAIGAFDLVETVRIRNMSAKRLVVNLKAVTLGMDGSSIVTIGLAVVEVAPGKTVLQEIEKIKRTILAFDIELSPDGLAKSWELKERPTKTATELNLVLERK